jgi:energy-coupling factor transporter ATP-binding protein EcfA2
MLRTITIDGFKSIQGLSLGLGRVNCLIGANGVGKSNILEAIGVLGAAANGTVDDEALLRRGVRPGLPRLYKSSFASAQTPAHISLSAADVESTDASGAVFRISLLNPLDNPSPVWHFKTEYLFDGGDEIVSDGIRGSKNLTKDKGLSALKLVELDPGNRAALLMAALQNYAIYAPSTATLRGMVGDPQARDPLGLSGGRLAEAFSEFKKARLNPDEDLLDDVLELVDWVKNVDTTTTAGSLLSPSVARTKNVLRFTDRFMKEGRNTLTAYDASEGALYILFSAILCLSSQAPKVFSIDNIDQALNPRLTAALIRKTSSWLRKAGSDRQLIFTAHNPAALDGLDLSDDEVRLFAVDRNSDGQTVVKRIEMTPDLIALQKDYPLSRLWLMGNLGAVPNV